MSDSYVGGFCSPWALVKPEMDLFFPGPAKAISAPHRDPICLCPFLGSSLRRRQPLSEDA